MKSLITMACASFLGAILGSWATVHVETVRAESASRLEAREIVLLRDGGKAGARVFTRDGGPVLQFYDSVGATAIEVGVDERQSERLLRFFDSDGSMIAAINALRPKGAATLYLGDQRFSTRMILGAIRSDMDPPSGINDWGIEILRPNSISPVVSINAHTGNNGARWRSGISITQDNGRTWSAPNE